MGPKVELVLTCCAIVRIHLWVLTDQWPQVPHAYCKASLFGTEEVTNDAATKSLSPNISEQNIRAIAMNHSPTRQATPPTPAKNLAIIKTSMLWAQAHPICQMQNHAFATVNTHLGP